MVPKNVKNIISRIKSEFYHVVNWNGVDFNQLKYLVLFLGNPRSGTTLIRTIIDAHPNAIIGNEVHILRCMENGETWEKVLKRLCISHDRFKTNPYWSGYSYHIDERIKKTQLFVVGDKRAVGTIKFFLANPSLLKELFTWSPVPIKIIRCVRHPLDVIATKHFRNKKCIDRIIEKYFFIEKSAEKLLGSLHCDVIHIYNDQIIVNPKNEILRILNFLELEPDSSFIGNCIDRIYSTKSLSRNKVDWKSEQLKEIESQTKSLPHLYRFT